MDGILSVIGFLTHKQETLYYNLPLLIITVVVLLVALFICVKISKRNRLYIMPKKNAKALHICEKNEAA